MGPKFPTGREEKRMALLAAVESVRETLVAGADEAETHATLPQATVQALDDAGLFALKLPAVLGGAEADLVTQLEVLEAISYIDTSAGWCTLIGAARA
jgi:indole-3-acetate monooxygenase